MATNIDLVSHLPSFGCHTDVKNRGMCAKGYGAQHSHCGACKGKPYFSDLRVHCQLLHHPIPGRVYVQRLPLDISWDFFRMAIGCCCKLSSVRFCTFPTGSWWSSPRIVLNWVSAGDELCLHWKFSHICGHPLSV